jgi:hypothetical protein
MNKREWRKTEKAWAEWERKIIIWEMCNNVVFVLKKMVKIEPKFNPYAKRIIKILRS